jgi:GTPase involved in cell partitioning and DNA repair
MKFFDETRIEIIAGNGGRFTLAAAGFHPPSFHL